MVKLRAPDGVSSIVHDGVEVPIGHDRSVEVDDYSAEVFMVHGFRPWNGGKNAVPIDGVPQSHKVVHLLARPRRPLDDLPVEGLQASLPATVPDSVIAPDDAETRTGYIGSQPPSTFRFPQSEGDLGVLACHQ